MIELLKIRIKPYLVDTGSTSPIFHPKIFAARNATLAKVVIGSANATSGGYYNNIEASTFIDLNLSNPDDQNFWDSIVNSLNNLKSSFPNNVITINRYKDVITLLNEGRLIDESIAYNTSRTGISTKPTLNPTPKMKLKVKRPTASFSKTRKRRRNANPTSIPSSLVTVNQPILVWESSPLKERDLNIPSGSNTHPTGSMTLRQGNWGNIDQRTYFRNIVFANLAWRNSNTKQLHLEYASANFELIIDGISYGNHQLVLKHDPRTTTASYRQKNAMTHLKWGSIAKPLIAKANLLNKTLKLYKISNTSFIIEIS